MNSNRALWTSVLLGTFLVGSAGVMGCREAGPKSTEFFGEDETQSVVTTLGRQAANGARQDGMLWEQHFDGPRLNALGRGKLDRMLARPGSVTVYLPGPVDQVEMESRRQAVLAYAKDAGRGAADVTVVGGVNPGTVHAAAPELARLTKTELGKTEQNGSTGADVPANTDGFGSVGNNSAGAAGSTAKGGG